MMWFMFPFAEFTVSSSVATVPSATASIDIISCLAVLLDCCFKLLNVAVLLDCCSVLLGVALLLDCCYVLLDVAVLLDCCYVLLDVALLLELCWALLLVEVGVMNGAPFGVGDGLVYFRNAFFICFELTVELFFCFWLPDARQCTTNLFLAATRVRHEMRSCLYFCSVFFYVL